MSSAGFVVPVILWGHEAKKSISKKVVQNELKYNSESFQN